MATPGSLSLLVRNGEFALLLFAADLARERLAIFEDRVAGTGNPAALRARCGKVWRLDATLTDPDILPSHEPETVACLASATNRGPV